MITPPPFSPRVFRALACATLACILALWPGRSISIANSHESQTWQWPVSRVGVNRAYLAPETEYSTGHRGIDLVAQPGDAVFTMAPGTVTFAGLVATTPVVVIAHSGGWRSSYLPVTSNLQVGQAVAPRQVIGHVGAPTEHCACLHVGLRFEGLYMSPEAVLGHIPRAVLLPW
ncbi:MAG: hypothetical protein RLZZ600_574 [Actinomycetota bacterium]|jgi:murein DD-endopeptidase MepM/ murein hydrolase activator NlpD